MASFHQLEQNLQQAISTGHAWVMYNEKNVCINSSTELS